MGSAAAFIAFGTPPVDDGAADLKYVLGIARELGQSMTDYLVEITKSAFPVGTAKKVRCAFAEELHVRNIDFNFDIVSNPEFMKQGAAIEVFMKPERFAVGVESEAQRIFDKMYSPVTLNGHQVLFKGIPSSELTKYAANPMLAMVTEWAKF